MKRKLVAAVQMNSGAELAANLERAAILIAEAAQAGARLAALPENFAHMGARDVDKLALAETPGAGPIQDFLARAAAQHRLWIVGGTLPMAAPDGRVYAASLLYDPQGRAAARYDKLHLFDVDLGGESYRESRTIAPGAAEPVIAATDLGALGLSVCYDLRFAELYRALSREGAEILTVPSAFTATTGPAHWEPLLRSRAIENQCYVIAPGQCGAHPGGRSTWGHSMIVDPWGTVLVQREHGEGVVLAELDPARQTQIRAAMPCLSHRRL